jgi:tRNA threonylcarbamoyladenosine biosynthesis protein TsaB
MILLAVDTTTPSGSVALFRGHALLGEVDLESATTHSARLLRSIDVLLKSQGLGVREVEAFAVAAGPGSFTGIRIGVTTVKSLAFASKKPVVPVSSLTALASKLASPGVGLAAPVLDAKKGEIYAGLFEARDRGLREVVPQGAYRPDAFVARLPARRAIAFIGNGVSLLRDRITARLGVKAHFPPRSPFIAAEVGRMGIETLERGGGVSWRELEPIYFRRSQAEEEAKP